MNRTVSLLIFCVPEQGSTNIELDLHPGNLFPLESSPPPDPPPPYTALQHEEPPPPYCHVAFTNKPQSPTVHIYLTGNEPVAHSSHGSDHGGGSDVDDDQKTSRDLETERGEEDTQRRNDAGIDNEAAPAGRSIDITHGDEIRDAAGREQTC